MYDDDIDQAIRRAIYTRFGREIHDEIGRMWADPPSLTLHSMRPAIQIPSISVITMLRDAGMAAYQVRAQIRSGPKEEWLGGMQMFSDRELYSTRDQVAILDHSLRSVRELFLHHLAEREIGGARK